MLKKIIMLIILFYFTGYCEAQVQELKPGWHTEELNLTWLDQYYPTFYNLEYQLYMIEVSNPEKYTILGRTEELIFSFTPETEGDYLLGVNAIKVFGSEDILEGPACWSNDPTCALEENTFFLKVETVNRGKNEPITRWKIMWK